ncbi:hypothetical protein C0V75_02550 [Tabrizicola sp. TH137]|uniref:CPBP family intramembrane glutamic endopeptidase n=1 Tax=Tabrizicola sp. TH137 TaxID=2067452 RepID=UPI000C7E0781|nr:CPBP family intramembrane glutamic endopeptidase [Tabrizicola sp. TH137]PLL14336.1 hypothetical protein C0V75_02550 [Tabrizicola sp. TH137]
MTPRIAIPITLAAFALWAAITVIGSRLMAGGTEELGGALGRGIDWPILAAGAFILGVALWQGRAEETGLRAVQHPGTLRLAWFPMLYILGGLGTAVALGLPPATVMIWVLINTLIVGFSEELMFRGVMLRSFRRRFSIWPAVLLTSLLFGAVHSLNIFTTGEVAQSLIQSCAAALSGLIFMAMRLRTGSIWPPMVLHGLWDFATFTLGASAQGGPTDATDPSIVMMVFPVLLVLPNAIYALYLMRNIGRDNADPSS